MTCFPHFNRDKNNAKKKFSSIFVQQAWFEGPHSDWIVIVVVPLTLRVCGPDIVCSVLSSRPDVRPRCHTSVSDPLLRAERGFLVGAGVLDSLVEGMVFLALRLLLVPFWLAVGSFLSGKKLP
jgi:hypothetical protein